ncbi:hypothetical protein Mapa_000399 [Marchantia paleacea]|nr:hypothetical protein Mapa_000399 [Marchantia paleacea]
MSCKRNIIALWVCAVVLQLCFLQGQGATPATYYANIYNQLAGWRMDDGTVRFWSLDTKNGDSRLHSLATFIIERTGHDELVPSR